MNDGNTQLYIKADQSGIAVYLPAHLTTDEICCELYRKFSLNAYAFAKAGTVPVSFRGKHISEAEADRIIDFLNRLDMNNIFFMRRKNACDCLENKYTDKDSVTLSDKIQSGKLSSNTAKIRTDKNSKGVMSEINSFIFKGNIEKKQTLEIRGNVIIIGNVSKYAKVISGGNIIVIGRLYGTAIAGRNTHGDSFIAAMYMSPKHLQIGKAVLNNKRILNYCDSAVLAANDGTSINITYI